MSGDASTTSIALRPWPAPTKDGLTTADLYEQVHQLAAQRGHLRNVTEKALQEEIDSGKDVTGDVMEGIEQEGDEDKKPQTKEEVLMTLATTREDVRRKLEYARFAAQNALDLVALVLSQTPISNNDTQFSQAIKDRRIPRGSFAVQRAIEETPAVLPTLAEDDALRAQKHRLASRGARMMALDSAVDHLLKSATLLDTEVRKEAKYWEDILSLSQKGWSIRRQKDQRHSPLIVEFGHPEASAQFKARGTAPLRMNKDGGIILDPALRLRPKTLRVRIKVGDKITGTSSLPAQRRDSDLDIEHAVRFARTSLFEEELFHSMTLESRRLLAYGVEQRDSVLHLPLPGPTKRTALIDCVPRDDGIDGGADLPQDWLAQNIADALRLLMEYEYRIRLNRRSALPPPLTQQKRASPDPPLLHSLMGILSHLYAVDSLSDYLQQVVRVFHSAGLDVRLEALRELTWASLATVTAESSMKGLSAVDQLLAAFIKPFEGKATLTLPSSNNMEQEQLTITTRTYFAPPTFGTEFKVTLPPSLASVLNLAQEQSRDFKMSSVEDVQSYLDWVLSLDLSHALLYKEYPKQAILKSKDPRIIISKKEGRKRLEQEVAVTLADGELVVDVISSSPPVRTFTWDGRKGKRSLMEEIKSCLS